ncbi:unnamed protein product [Leuciscus chuanchicus]
MLPTRKRRPEVAFPRGHEEVKFRDLTLYLVEKRMGKSRRNFLSNLARTKGFCVDDALSGNVTHVVSEGNTAQDLWNWLEEQGFGETRDTHVLNISWFTESMSAGRPVPVELRHYIQNPAVDHRSCAHPSDKPESAVSPYACQRRTTLDNHNKIFTDALEVLAENMEFIGNRGPCLAFRRAASVLKSLCAPLQHLEETHRLPCLGEHSKDILEEIFECGSSSRAEDILNDERYRTMKNILLYSDFQDSTFDLSQLPNHRFEAMDHFSKCFLIVKLKREQESCEREASRDWKAVRVDLVAPPLERYAYALLGWTGSTLFERDLRRFARLERGKLLDNHVLYDKATKTLLPACTEEEIFAHLGLEYIEPWQRNA